MQTVWMPLVISAALLGCGRDPEYVNTYTPVAEGWGGLVASCIGFEGNRVGLRGTLRELTFPGPPNFEDTARGDEPERGHYLDLSTAMCMRTTPRPESGDSLSAVTRLQLILDPAERRALKGRIGEVVDVQGLIVMAQTGHHHTPVLLDVVWIGERKSR